MIGIIFHDRILFTLNVMHLPDGITDTYRHIIKMLQGFVIGSSFHSERFGIYSEIDYTVGTLSNFFYFLIPVIQKGLR
jgi:hypothetical protein